MLFMNEKYKIAVELFMGALMMYVFLLIYSRGFAPKKEEWINSHLFGKHFESRPAHVHGNLFTFLNMVIDYLLIQFQNKLTNSKIISGLSLLGLLMPIGILAEVYFRSTPIFVLFGAIAMTVAVLVRYLF